MHKESMKKLTKIALPGAEMHLPGDTVRFRRLLDLGVTSW
jgi:hypothetical protein